MGRDAFVAHTHDWGHASKLAFTDRELDGGPKVYRACDWLQQAISKLYRQSGIKLGSSHNGRRSLAAKVLAATGDVKTVQTILGHSCLDHSKPYLTKPQSDMHLRLQWHSDISSVYWTHLCTGMDPMHLQGRAVQAEVVEDARYSVHDMEMHNGVKQKVIAPCMCVHGRQKERLNA